MSVPTHYSSCTSWTFPVNCWDCGERIFIFQCTCGSTVRFDRLGGAWPQHDCGGEPLPTGWAAIRKLESMGVEIDEKVLEYAFGKNEPKTQTPPPIVKITPTHAATENHMLVLRECQSDTKIIKEIQSLGAIGLGMLGLTPNQELRQLTLHDTSNEQAKSFTCFISARHEPSKSDLGRLFGITLSGFHVGSLKIWLASDLVDLDGI